MLPILASITVSENAHSVGAVRESRKSLLAFGLFLPVLVLFRGEDIVRLLFGESYRQAGMILVLLSFTLPAICIGILPSNLLTAQGKQWQNLKFVFAAAVISITCNLVLIQRLGMTGAAITANLTYFVLVAFQVRAGLSLSREMLRLREDLPVVLPALFAVTAFLFLARSWPAIFVILAAGCIYLVALRIRGLSISLKAPARSVTEAEPLALEEG
jgi:O-antigen/teichoic acid export membrane protein